MRLDPGGSASVTPPPPPPPKPHPAPSHVTASHTAASNLQSTQASSFDQAVAQARAERSAVDGLPTAAHGYETATLAKPGDTLFGIASAHGDRLGAEEAANAQITDPNRVLVGQVVFSPGQSPVSAPTTAQIEAAESSGSQQQWAKAQSAIADDLRAQGNGRLQPDQAVQPTVKALDQWALGNDKLRQATQAAYNQVNSEWQQQGITSQQLAPMLKDRQSQAWSKVQQDTQHWLQSSVGLRAFPEDLGAQRVKQLDALFPGDQKFAQANQAALQGAKQTWQSLGITHDKLDPVLSAYNGYESAVQRQQDLRSRNPSAAPLLSGQVNAAQSRLQGAIERQLGDAANQAGSPQAAAQAMLVRAGILRTVGPQTADFSNAVNAANTDMQVNKPAQQVAAAYQHGGAAGAAKALLTATQDALPGDAGAIIKASQPTIEKIAGDLNSMATNSVVPQANPQVTSIYGDLSAAVEQTDHGTSPTSLGTETTQAADLVAGALASHLHMPNTSALGVGTGVDPLPSFVNGAQGAVGNGQGASLSLAFAAALKQRGQSAAANLITEGAARGYQQLKARTDSDVQSFAKVTGNVEQLRSTWAPFMTSAQLSAATAGYARRNPQFLQQFAQTLATVQQDGTQVVQARQAFSAYQSQLADLSSHQDLVGGANNLTGNDPRTFFAVQESGQVTMNVARALTENVPGAQADYSTALDAPGVARSIRTMVNQYLKSKYTTPLTTADGKPGKPGTLTNGALSTIGLGLTIPTALSELQHFNQLDFAGKAVFAYNDLGFAKYTGESLSYATRLAQTSGIRYLSAVANSNVGNGLANLTNDKTDLGSAFKLYGSFYYLVGAFANGASAQQAASTGDIPSAALNSTTALGNVLLAGNASKDAITSTLQSLGVVDDAGAAAVGNFLDAAGPIGAGLSVLAQFGLAAYASYQQKQALNTLQSQGQGFLEDGLHLNPSVAYQLADVSDNQHLGPAPVLQAYANQYHVQPQALLDFLNKQNATDVGSFVYLAENLTPDKNGQYKATDPSDKQNLYYIPGVPYQNSVEFPNLSPPLVDSPDIPVSLRGLHYWAQAIFPGQNLPATS